MAVTFLSIEMVEVLFEQTRIGDALLTQLCQYLLFFDQHSELFHHLGRIVETSMCFFVSDVADVFKFLSVVSIHCLSADRLHVDHLCPPAALFLELFLLTMSQQLPITLRTLFEELSTMHLLLLQLLQQLIGLLPLLFLFFLI